MQDEVEERFDSIFGGSVAKHTWVDGLSDIDSGRKLSEDVGVLSVLRHSGSTGLRCRGVSSALSQRPGRRDPVKARLKVVAERP